MVLIFYAAKLQVREENPESGLGQIQKIIGEKWKALSAEEKVKYEEEAKKDKIRYNEEMEAYNLKLQTQAAEQVDMD